MPGTVNISFQVTDCADLAEVKAKVAAQLRAVLGAGASWPEPDYLLAPVELARAVDPVAKPAVVRWNAMVQVTVPEPVLPKK